MTVIFRATKALIDLAYADLRRPHPFAHERVGWLTVRPAAAGTALLLLADNYHSVPDNHYIADPKVGARIDSNAIRDALNLALLQKVGVFHVHIHDHRGVPEFSHTDKREQLQYVPDFFAVRRDKPHGAVLFSRDSFAGRVWLATDKLVPIREFQIVGRTSTVQPIGQGRRGFWV